QVMDSPYANGAYSPPYPPCPGMLQARGYYCSGNPRPPYPPESHGMYRPPSPTPSWSYAEGSSLRRPQGPSYSPPETPGMPIPHYPYGDSTAGLTPQGPPPQPRAPEETWAPHPVYGVQPRYAWPAAPVHGNPFLSDSHPSWPGSGAPSHPPAWDSKDTVYESPEQSANQHNYYSPLSQQLPGAMSEQPAGAPLGPSPRVQYSAQPQLYERSPRQRQPSSRDTGSRAGERLAASPVTIQPEIQRILRVLGEAEQLEQEVDEFVGKKTDKSYRLLEEMLTKLLLELDSIETGGQDGVRQARKESVHRIQAILEKLERKGL
ncbi:BAG4 regulator, partial [Centropus unirufus]|nr:BAG4 regulator [Centropus unirufus]